MLSLRWYIYPLLLLAIIYTAHFAVDLFIPFETTAEHVAMAEAYLERNQLPTPDFVFTSDGCTLWPDALFFHDFTSACLTHDIAYWAGGSPELQQQTNQSLQEDIAQTGPLGPVFGYLMYVGVKYLGDNGVSHMVGSEWGYGWK